MGWIRQHTIEQYAQADASSLLSPYFKRLNAMQPMTSSGIISRAVGLVVESNGPAVSVGDMCLLKGQEGEPDAELEVIGFRDETVLLMPLGRMPRVRAGDSVIAAGTSASVPVGERFLGRVIDAMGRPLDDRGPIEAKDHYPLHRDSTNPLARANISEPLGTGVRSIDGLLTVGVGQRIGIFGGSGVGKSTLLGMIASRAESDVNVIALIGERGREVREFLEKDLDEAGRKRSVIVVATSNEPALARVKGAFAATTIAEHFRDQGKNVLLMMDSVTRFAMAQREIGLAVGEPPTTRGYTPSVFSMLPQLLERAGTGERGSITGLFTTLVEQDDMNDPIADAVRSILDGHIVLTRDLATQNHYPAIDVLDSVSRLTRDLCSSEQVELAGKAREAMSLYRRNQDLINIGAYPAGSNATIDHAIRLHEPLKKFLRQGVREGFSGTESWQLLAQSMATQAAAAPRTVTTK